MLIAVAGEVVCDWSETTGKRAWWKKFFMALLVIGLTYELVEASITDKEASEAIERSGIAEQKAGAANERAANTESNNLVLQAKVLELEIKLRKQIRKISPDDNDEFIAFLKNCPHKKPIGVFVEKSIFESDFETRNYTKQIRRMLDDAGFGGTNNDIQQLENYSLFLSTSYTNADTPFFIVAYGQQGNIDWPGLEIAVDQNKRETVMNFTPQDFSCLGYVDAAFIKIGAAPIIMIRTDCKFVKTNGDWAIFIPGRF